MSLARCSHRSVWLSIEGIDRLRHRNIHNGNIIATAISCCFYSPIFILLLLTQIFFISSHLHFLHLLCPPPFRSPQDSTQIPIHNKFFHFYEQKNKKIFHKNLLSPLSILHSPIPNTILFLHLLYSTLFLGNDVSTQNCVRAHEFVGDLHHYKYNPTTGHC